MAVDSGLVWYVRHVVLHLRVVHIFFILRAYSAGALRWVSLVAGSAQQDLEGLVRAAIEGLV